MNYSTIWKFYVEMASESLWFEMQVADNKINRDVTGKVTMAVRERLRFSFDDQRVSFVDANGRPTLTAQEAGMLKMLAEKTAPPASEIIALWPEREQQVEAVRRKYPQAILDFGNAAHSRLQLTFTDSAPGVDAGPLAADMACRDLVPMQWRLDAADAAAARYILPMEK